MGEYWEMTAAARDNRKFRCPEIRGRLRARRAGYRKPSGQRMRVGMGDKDSARRCARGITRRRLLEGVGLGAAALAAGPSLFGQVSEALAAPLPAGYFHTRGAQILDADNNPACLAGVNWYGFECNSMVPGGLSYQTLDYICRKVVNLGFNLIRLPYSVQAVRSNPRIDNYLDANDHLRGGPCSKSWTR